MAREWKDERIGLKGPEDNTVTIARKVSECRIWGSNCKNKQTHEGTERLTKKGATTLLLEKERAVERTREGAIRATRNVHLLRSRQPATQQSRYAVLHERGTAEWTVGSGGASPQELSEEEEEICSGGNVKGPQGPTLGERSERTYARRPRAPWRVRSWYRRRPHGKIDGPKSVRTGAAQRAESAQCDGSHGTLCSSSSWRERSSTRGLRDGYEVRTPATQGVKMETKVRYDARTGKLGCWVELSPYKRIRRTREKDSELAREVRRRTDLGATVAGTEGWNPPAKTGENAKGKQSMMGAERREGNTTRNRR